MVRIYISSTYSDLKECREKVYHKLRELQHDVVAMEDYVAGDQRPLDKCLEDVVNCDLYVGLFAWRYGYIPPQDNPEHKSITELEYHKAGETGKSRFIFLLEEGVLWSPNDMDQLTGEGDQGKRIMELRKELRQVVQIPPLHKVLSDDAAQFAEENVYPEQCNFVRDDLQAASELIQELVDVVTHLPITAGTLRFQLSNTLYHTEALASELIQLVTAFRPICRSGSRQMTTKKNQIQLKLHELAQSLESSNKTLAQLTNNIQGKKTVVNSYVQQPQPVPVPVSPKPSSSAFTTPVKPAPHVTESTEIGFTQLREIMYRKFDADAFKLLCIDMGTDYDSLKEGGLELKMSYLIDHCIRHNKYEVLKQHIREKFPDLQGQL